ncbi:DUF11 domain-containing protein [Paraurantiacibacter namhicola]|uniref:DUF11 domain-containing protein n=1 Tax=Paraurantiacibacter namhicola TaxID=645517 RepID=A0A1C7DAC7_9SPHN|nr:DUF11 domain-containing protein [Paraurantiacibacter namhicola]ANU08446.1 hypothetical protein A6F65_02160 [Paraurantiacibacter namhicola]
MKRTRQFLGAVSSFALVTMMASPAMAAGTGAGETIENTVSVSFSVGGVEQTAETATDEFTVDRKIDVTVAAVGASPNVSANQDGVVRQFTVTNLSNDTVGFDLTATQPGTPAYTFENVVIFVDADGDGAYDVGEEIDFIDSLAPDATFDVWVAFDIPATATDGQSTDIILTANAFEAGTGTIGAEIEDTATANDKNGIDTVLADGDGVADNEFEGDFSAAHTVEVDAADVTVVKTSRVVWDPVNLATDPYAIPGARVEYCIQVSNATGAATATGITVSDTLPAEVSFYPDAYGTTGDVKVNGTVDGSGVCSGGTEVDGYTTASTAVSEALDDVAGGETKTLYFTVTID